MVYRMGPAPAGTCPRCRETLLGVELGDGPVARVSTPNVRWCERCGGVFVDVEGSRRVMTTLDRALADIAFEAARGRARRHDEGRTISCPECLIEMIKTRIESAQCDVDACPLHGTWFDAGELGDVMRAFANARRRGVFARQASPGAPALDVEPPAPPPSPVQELIDFVRSLLR